MRYMRLKQKGVSSVTAIVLCLCLAGCGLTQKWNRARADDLISEAGKKFAESDFKGNIQLLSKAAKIDSRNPRVWWKLCEGYQLTEDFDLAIAACRRNIAVHADAISYNSLGLAYMAKRDYANAASAFEESVKQSPSGIFYRNLVWSLESGHQYGKAVPAAQRWVELTANDASEHTWALESLGAICMEIGQPEKAKEAFAKVHETDPNVISKPVD